MTDHFATLGQPRRPWLDPDALKEAFHRLSAELHPDVPATGNAAGFAAVNAAYGVLKDPASRLRHLIARPDAASGARLSQPPADLADCFMQVSFAQKRLADFRARMKAASTALSRAMLAADEATLRREFALLEQTNQQLEAAALAELRELDAQWNPDDPALADRLLALADRLGYVRRWQDQTREALFALGG